MPASSLRVLYGFPEPLPLPRARGVQAIHAVHSLAAEVASVDLAFEATDQAADPFAAYGLERPANVRLLPISRRAPWPLGLLGVRSQRFFARRLVGAIAASPPDVILVRHIKLACALGRARPDIPLVYEAHEVFADTTQSGTPGRVGAVEACAVAAARRILANSAATAARLHQRYPDAVAAIVLANGVRVPPAPMLRDWDAAVGEIVYAGSLFGWKGVDDLIAAAAWLPGKRITIIGGSSEDVDRLRGRLPAGGADIVLAGRLPHDEVQRRLARAGIAVLPNRPDPDSAFTSPLKLFEYLAAGCAVVATDLPPIREIVADGEVAWAAAGDPRDLAGAISRLAADPQTARAVADRGFQRARGYAWERRARRLAEVLNDAHVSPE